jgi:hypothetical protein
MMLLQLFLAWKGDAGMKGQSLEGIQASLGMQ